MRSLVLYSASAALFCGACASPSPTTPANPPRFTLRAPPADGALADELHVLLSQGLSEVEDFFGRPFAAPVEVLVFDDRASFDASLPPEWGLAQTECWMVASGVANTLRLLSPRVWQTEACEHDPDDARHVRNLIVHELVHVFHGQHNPAGDFEGLDDLGWFLEGLATYASGQLREGHVADAREAIDLDLIPERLSLAWSGKYRYGVSGSLVEYLDVTFGRDVLRGMLPATGQSELLAPTGLSEQELLASWETFVRGRGER